MSVIYVDIFAKRWSLSKLKPCVLIKGVPRLESERMFQYFYKYIQYTNYALPSRYMMIYRFYKFLKIYLSYSVATFCVRLSNVCKTERNTNLMWQCKNRRRGWMGINKIGSANMKGKGSLTTWNDKGKIDVSSEGPSSGVSSESKLTSIFPLSFQVVREPLPFACHWRHYTQLATLVRRIWSL